MATTDTAPDRVQFNDITALRLEEKTENSYSDTEHCWVTCIHFNVLLKKCLLMSDELGLVNDFFFS